MTLKQWEIMSDRIADKTLPIEIPETADKAHTISQRVAYLLSDKHESLSGAESVLVELNKNLPGALQSAFVEEDPAALLDIQKALFAIYEVSFINPLSSATVHEHSLWLLNIRNVIETAWLGYEQPRIDHELPSDAELANEERLAAWFIDQARRETPLDRMVVRFLTEEATIDHFKTFILSDMHLNYRFYDALVLAQLHFSECVKQELSHHMWDECGCGDSTNAHTRQFTRMLQKLNLSPRPIPIWNDWRPYAGYNLYLCFGLNRRHYFKAIGSLAMPELFDPDRDRAVITGLERLNFNAKEDFMYYYSHIEGDEEHGPGWLNHVILPIVKAQPDAARELAIGGALRMEYMRYFNTYLAEKFGLLN